nr:unnamed protein product [Callosobruchus analis]
MFRGKAKLEPLEFARNVDTKKQNFLRSQKTITKANTVFFVAETEISPNIPIYPCRTLKMVTGNDRHFARNVDTKKQNFLRSLETMTKANDRHNIFCSRNRNKPKYPDLSMQDIKDEAFKSSISLAVLALKCLSESIKLVSTSSVSLPSVPPKVLPGLGKSSSESPAVNVQEPAKSEIYQFLKIVSTALLSTEMLKELQKFTGADGRNAAVIWALHGLLVPTNIVLKKYVTGKNTTTKFTVKDSQESVLFVGQNQQEIEEGINHLRATNMSIQPSLYSTGRGIFSMEEICKSERLIETKKVCTVGCYYFYNDEKPMLLSQNDPKASEKIIKKPHISITLKLRFLNMTDCWATPKDFLFI